MKLNLSTAEIFIPDGFSETAALSRVTHLGIVAHQDDLEFMAFHGIKSGAISTGCVIPKKLLTM